MVSFFFRTTPSSLTSFISSWPISWAVLDLPPPLSLPPSSSPHGHATLLSVLIVVWKIPSWGSAGLSKPMAQNCRAREWRLGLLSDAVPPRWYCLVDRKERRFGIRRRELAVCSRSSASYSYFRLERRYTLPTLIRFLFWDIYPDVFKNGTRENFYWILLISCF